MKGIFKSLRYISQIFDEEKEEEIQIGGPTDVKHVAHIGWDGGESTADNNPSWMKDFKGSAGVQSDDSKDNSEIDSNRRGTDKDPDLPKSSRRQSENPDSPKSKNKPSRRNRSKDADSAAAAGDLPDIPKKSRRKKSKDSVGGDGSARSTRSSKRNAAAQDSDREASVKSAYSDFEFGDGSAR
ncbi:PREDICTED: CRIB domain-containing protein RIC6-like [Ipomoea nil]|uniref:CRIB domain-containing protein RIC6-like n=1 Tax=Ipomoea nil TaxID=35883 RepID=UPI000901445B|nr:PREDICTED: CRIB domain-containing protein RIC6-like [Ipomoea nil]XP_019178546.1 PREDICTED: CRIB domain-containing protein RIC6-like [Ipomoea nil]